MPPSDFNHQLHRSQVDAEKPIAGWFQRDGALVLPGYNFSGAGAPKLEAFSATESEIIPDLLVARAGVMFWVEVKLKSAATPTKNLRGQLDTGISYRLWKEYLRVRDTTGAKVFLCFAHEKEDMVTLDDTSVLEKHPGRRIDLGEKMERGGMIFWPLLELTRVASLTKDVRQGGAPNVQAIETSRRELEEMTYGRRFAQLPLELRLKDVCSGCGLHIISSVRARLAWLKAGDPVCCSHCEITRHSPRASIE